MALSLALICAPFTFLSGCEYLPYGEPTVGGQAVRYDFVSTADGLNLPCSIYLPKGYDPSRSYPLWVELHALEGTAIISNNPWDMFSNSIKSVADTRGWIVLSPWCRNLGSYYIDGVRKDSGANREPDIIDDMSSLDGWAVAGGSWSAVGGALRQSDGSSAWKELVRSGSSGQDYAVRVSMRELSRAGSVSAMGINLRRDPVTGDCYHADLLTETTSAGTVKYVRLFRYGGGAWTLIGQTALEWKPLTAGDTWIRLKVTSYDGYIRVAVNDKPVNLQVPGDDSPYGTGWLVPEPPVSGEVSVCSLGGVHEFGELRVQNDFAYGQQDTLDCINQAMEKFNIDEDRIYASGLSMGACGAYILGIHAPGLVAAVSPNAGASDFVYDYEFLRDHFPVDPGEPFARYSDHLVCSTWRLIAGMEHQPDQPLDTPLMKDFSARYVLENMANMPVRIVQGLNDSNFPNMRENLTVMWWRRSDPASHFWWHVEAPAPYSPATATFENGGDIHDLLTTWSAQGPYYSEYVTSPYGGHGFMEPYEVTAAFFAAQARKRHPTQVAYKSYDDEVSEAYWLKMKRFAAAGEEAALARAEVDNAANALDTHTRNVERLTLDLAAAGADIGAGETVTLRLDSNTDPSAIPVTDVLGRTDLELLHAWPPVSGLEVRLDGAQLVEGSGYTLQGASLSIPSIALDRQRTVTVTMPASLPPNLLSNASFEDVNADGTLPGWSPLALPGGSVSYEANRMQSHSGERSLRIKDPAFSTPPYICAWNSAMASGIEPGKGYRLHVSCRTRMFKGASIGAAIYWYDASGNQVGTSPSPLETTQGYSTHGWTPLSCEAFAPAGAAYAVVSLQTVGAVGAAAKGSVWFDDAFLYEVNP
ncbi:MAG: hypothetical protein AB1384_07535 [Actinomycetota bacterium]